jgi:hypothetical protein
LDFGSEINLVVRFGKMCLLFTRQKLSHITSLGQGDM